MIVMRKKLLVAIVSGITCLAVGCSTKEPSPKLFQDATEPFIFDSLAMTPIEATELGYHEYVKKAADGGEASQQVALDVLLDDYSPEGVQKRIARVKAFLAKLKESIPDRSKEKGDLFVDYATAENLAARMLFELEEVKSYEHYPILYVQLLGRAIYTPLTVEYASKPDRFKHIIARLQKFPAFLMQAKQNLKSSPEVWTKTARSENDGIIHLVERVIAGEAPAELKGEYDAAAKTALDALRDFNNYLDTDLSKRKDYDWRLGAALYGKKWQLWTAGASKTPDQVLADAEKELDAVTAELIATAKPVHQKIYGNQRPPTDDALIRDVLDVVSDENRLNSGDGLLDQIKKDIEEVKQFSQAQELAPIPPANNLKLIETPEFLRASHPVANYIGAPPLQPQLSAFFMLTPIPSDWSRDRVLSKLREYNLFQLKLLTVEYAIPGYHTAHEFTNTAEPQYRRLLHAQGNPAFNDGWGAYITETAVATGLAGGNDLKVIYIKTKLRIITDVIIDIRMHTKDMSEAEATKLLRERAYQEAEGARDRIQRAMITSSLLPLSYFGSKEWLRVREHYQNQTQDFSLRSFHEKALRAGPMAFNDLGYATAQIPM